MPIRECRSGRPAKKKTPRFSASELLLGRHGLCAGFDGRRLRGPLSASKRLPDEEDLSLDPPLGGGLRRHLSILTGGGNDLSLLLRYADEQVSQVQLARHLGCDRTTVGRRIRRFLDGIRGELDLPASCPAKVVAWIGAVAKLSHTEMCHSGGCTTDVREAELIQCPTPLYVVSRAGLSVTFAACPTVAQVARYVLAHRDIFLHDSHAHLGGWQNPRTGTWVLGISECHRELPIALALARQHGEEAIAYLGLATPQTLWLDVPSEERRRAA